MKTFIAIILSAFAILGNNFCSAERGRYDLDRIEMNRYEMFLGGLTFGSSIDTAFKMYGKPTANEQGAEFLSICNYGSGVEIAYLADTRNIFTIIVRENNGWTTPAGLAVGTNREKIFELYGQPEFTKVGKDKTAYAYFYYRYGSQNTYEREAGFIILVDNATGKILEMRVETDNSMVGFEDYFEPSINYLLGIENE